MSKLALLRPISLAALVAAPCAAFSASNYNFAEAGAVHFDDAADETGVRLMGSADIYPQFALQAEYATAEDLDLVSAGALFHMPYNPVLDMVMGASVEHAEFATEDDTGFGLRAGLRWQFHPRWGELQPELRYVNLNDSTTSLRLGAQVPLNQVIDLQGAWQGGDDDRLEVGLRYNFGTRTGMTGTYGSGRGY